MLIQKDPKHARAVISKQGESNFENSREHVDLEQVERDTKDYHREFARKATPTILENVVPEQTRATGQFLSKDLEGLASPTSHKDFLLQRKNSNPDFTGNQSA